MSEASSWTWASIIDALGGTGAVTEALELEWDSVVSGWRRRGIPPQRWAAIVRLATEKGVSGISFEALTDLSERRPADLLEARA